jgi:hypothetical protein
MDPISESQWMINRRHFFGRAATGIGGVALASVLNADGFAAPSLATNNGPGHGPGKKPGCIATRA